MCDKTKSLKLFFYRVSNSIYVDVPTHNKILTLIISVPFETWASANLPKPV